MQDPSSPTFTPAQLQLLQHHISNAFSTDIQKVNDSNAVLAQLKQQDGLILNIVFVLENAQLERTRFYVLVVFEQRLPGMWEGLSKEYRAGVREYFAGMFMRLARRTDQDRAVANTVASILVKTFIYGHEEYPTFVEDMAAEAKKDQMVCDAVMTAFNILADETAELKANNLRPAFLAFIQNKYECIVVLSLMVIEASRTNKLRIHLMKSTLELLEKFLNLIPPGMQLPQQTQQALLELLQSNVFRQKVVRLLTTVIANAFSIEFYLRVVAAVASFLASSVDLPVERAKIAEASKKDLEPFDLLMRALAGMFQQIITNLEQNAKTCQLPPSMLRTCYEYILQLSQLPDEDTWQSCLQAWVTYYRHSLQLDLQTERLVAPLVRKSVTPLELRPSATDTDDSTEISFVICELAKKYLARFEQAIWQAIEKHIYVRFNEQLFTGACNCLCYLSPFYTPADKEKLTNILKLLLNLNQSTSPENRPTVVTHTLNLTSFYPWILNNNPFLSEVVEHKYVENIPASLDALTFLAKRYALSAKTVAELEEKAVAVQRQGGAVETTIKRIWTVVLVGAREMRDVREAGLQADGEQMLSYVLRNYAAMELFGLRWETNWQALKVVFHRNVEMMKQILRLEGEHALKFAKNSAHMKTHTCTIKLCCLFCKLCQQAGVPAKSNPQFLSFVEQVIANSSMSQLNELAQLLN